MDDLLLPALIAAAIIGIIAVLLILWRGRRDQDVDSPDRPFAASTEGMKICPRCGLGNLWTERTCSSCGARLPG
jgi:hypothetical protein